MQCVFWCAVLAALGLVSSATRYGNFPECKPGTRSCEIKIARRKKTQICLQDDSIDSWRCECCAKRYAARLARVARINSATMSSTAAATHNSLTLASANTTTNAVTTSAKKITATTETSLTADVIITTLIAVTTYANETSATTNTSVTSGFLTTIPTAVTISANKTTATTRTCLKNCPNHNTPIAVTNATNRIITTTNLTLTAAPSSELAQGVISPSDNPDMLVYVTSTIAVLSLVAVVILSWICLRHLRWKCSRSPTPTPRESVNAMVGYPDATTTTTQGATPGTSEIPGATRAILVSPAATQLCFSPDSVHLVDNTLYDSFSHQPPVPIPDEYETAQNPFVQGATPGTTGAFRQSTASMASSCSQERSVVVDNTFYEVPQDF